MIIFPKYLVASLWLLSRTVPAVAASPASTDEGLSLNASEYLEMPGLNVMLAHDYYPEGHQGGVIIIQNGQRVATNGDLRLQPTPGQWQPTPVVTGQRQIDRTTQAISVRMSYPDESKDRKGFNPVTYPDLKLSYVVRVQPSGKSFRITVDLDHPLPDAWIGKVGFNLELYPGILFGKSFSFGNQFGTFPRQANGPGALTDGDYQLAPLGHGRKLTLAPESDQQRLTIDVLGGGELELLDGRAQHNNGWFVVRALVPKSATTHAIDWLVTPHALPHWKSEPAIQISQVGYHPKQAKIAVIELDQRETVLDPVALYRVALDGNLEKIVERMPKDWGRFLRYHYLQFDFTEIEKPGIYVLAYGNQRSSAFQISPEVFQRHVWQPTIEYFLPVQMCHMRVNDKYRVWHGLCHADDALMAPVNHNHFDGYEQGPSTLTRYQPGEHIPGLDHGGWHDAGDYDIRLESQAKTVHGLALAWELFRPTLDNTTVDETARIVEIHRPDGKPDVLQQIEHGVLSMVGAYHSMNRLYSGIQDASLHQYTHLGDAHDMTDNLIFHDTGGAAMKALAKAARTGDQSEPEIEGLPPLGSDGSADDRWVFTENSPEHELIAVSALSAASRALKGYNDPLATDCAHIAQEIWASENELSQRSLIGLEAAIELFQTTGDRKYVEIVAGLADEIVSHVDEAGWLGARSLALVNQAGFTKKIKDALRKYHEQVHALAQATPYGFPYKPGVGFNGIWGAGWAAQRFGVEQYFLHTGAPEIFSADYLLHAIDFVLGCHPGQNPASLVSGVGAISMIPAYGANRAEWSYIPGGSASGIALIHPDFPELLEWPFLWQQGEYCLGAPTSDYVFLILAADHLLNEPDSRKSK